MVSGKMAVGVVALVAAIVAMARSPQELRIFPEGIGSAMVQEVTFNIWEEGSYAKFIKNLRDVLPDNPVMLGPDKKHQRPVLANQSRSWEPPPRWIHVELKGKNGSAPKVAIRSDNVYLFAFTNMDGKWFKLTKDKEDNESLVLPEAEPVGFKDTYKALVGGANNLCTLNLGMFTTSKAAMALWEHTKKKSDLKPELTLRKALATLCVVVCEAARFAPVYNVVDSGWKKQAGAYITVSDVGNYINNWSCLSRGLLGWMGDNYTNDTKWFGNLTSNETIHNGREALKKVELIKGPKRIRLAWLKHLWGLLVNGKAAQAEKELAKSSAVINPL